MSKVGNFFIMCGKGIIIAFRYLKKKQLLVPLLLLVVLLIINVIINSNNFGSRIIDILNDASEVAILAIGMTFVTSACGGQDISVGAGIAIVSALVMKLGAENQLGINLIVVFLICITISVALSAFNGVLVSYFKILPMVATLILFRAGRDIAYLIGGPSITAPDNSAIKIFGSFIPGTVLPMPILITIVCVAIIVLVLRFSNLGLYTQSVGINAKAARLNGIKPERVKMLSFIILGVCVCIAGFVNIGRNASITSYDGITSGIELDVILAVAIGGTILGGGKFNLAGSLIGAYTIQLLTSTLLRIPGSTTSTIVFYKAIFVIVLIVLGSPVIREKLSLLFAKLKYSFKTSEKNEIKKEGA